jgi:hypothetical protein
LCIQVRIGVERVRGVAIVAHVDFMSRFRVLSAEYFATLYAATRGIRTKLSELTSVRRRRRRGV